MMKKEYVVDYDFGSGEVIFEIDFNKFKKNAQITLDFFLWSYDKDECPVTEAVKKYAESCMRFCMREETTSIPYIVDTFEQEGFCDYSPRLKPGASRRQRTALRLCSPKAKIFRAPLISRQRIMPHLGQR